MTAFTGTGNLIDSGEVTVNGISLGALAKTPSEAALSASDVKAWLDTTITAQSLPIKVTANNQIDVDVSKLELTGLD